MVIAVAIATHAARLVLASKKVYFHVKSLAFSASASLDPSAATTLIWLILSSI